MSQNTTRAINEELKKILDQTENEFDFYSGGEIVDYVLSELQTDDSKRIIEYPHKELNNAFRGIFPTSFVIIGADTGLGKSELLGSIVLSACEQGKRVVYFDFENDDGDFVMRQISRMVSVMRNQYFSVADLRLCNVESDPVGDQIYKAAELLSGKIKTLKLFKNDRLPKVDDFVEQLELMDDVDLVCIDHLHYFDFETGENQAVQIGRVMRALRNLTKKRIPIVMASHLKQRSQNKAPSNYDLFGSSNIAKEAKSVILMSKEQNQTLFQITKNRDGGKLCEFYADYDQIKRELIFKSDNGQPQAGFGS